MATWTREAGQPSSGYLRGFAAIGTKIYYTQGSAVAGWSYDISKVIEYDTVAKTFTTLIDSAVVGAGYSDLTVFQGELYVAINTYENSISDHTCVSDPTTEWVGYVKRIDGVNTLTTVREVYRLAVCDYDPPNVIRLYSDGDVLCVVAFNSDEDPILQPDLSSQNSIKWDTVQTFNGSTWSTGSFSLAPQSGSTRYSYDRDFPLGIFDIFKAYPSGVIYAVIRSGSSMAVHQMTLATFASIVASTPNGTLHYGSYIDNTYYVSYDMGTATYLEGPASEYINATQQINMPYICGLEDLGAGNGSRLWKFNALDPSWDVLDESINQSPYDPSFIPEHVAIIRLTTDDSVYIIGYNNTVSGIEVWKRGEPISDPAVVVGHARLYWGDNALPNSRYIEI